uniref:WAP domain-containing protein n=1 Tax=Podarcis muralis TaxID=64176 RepID=A0A670INB7_PODMU
TVCDDDAKKLLTVFCCCFSFSIFRQGKPGICPIDRCRCTGPQPDECRDDYICLGQKKCCYSCCAMRCVDPEFRNVECKWDCGFLSLWV